MNVRRSSVLVVLLASQATALFAQTGSGPVEPDWDRYPALSPDGGTIAFSYMGDLYRVNAAGGLATPLTSHPAHDFMPVWSHDGKMIAFASDRHGNFDVYVMPAMGGEPRRLTFHSAPEYPYAFDADDRSVLFGAALQDAASNRGFPAAYQPELYRVPVGGGRVQQVLTTPAVNAQVGGGGAFLIYEDQKGQESEWRKHHTSSVARDIWIYDVKSGKHRKVTTFAGEDRNPVLTADGRAFYYLSEASGSFNVYRMSLDGGAPQQVTTFEGPPVRFLSVAENGTLCFSWDGALYTQRGSGQAAKVHVSVAADAKANNERVIPVTGGARDMAVSPSGKEVAFIVRGEVFVTAVEGTATKQITHTPGQEADVSFSPDGNTLLYASERDGRWRIFQARRTRAAEPYFYASTVVAETPLLDDGHEHTQPEYSPDGGQVAYVEDRSTVKVLDVASGKTRTLLTAAQVFSTSDGGQWFQWSPDGQWIVFDYAIPGLAPGEVGLVKADGSGQVVNLTQSGFEDRRGKWVLGGRAMIWMSNRDGLKSVAQSGGSQYDVYGMFFTRDAWDRFRLSKEDYALLENAEDRNKPKADSTKRSDAEAKPPAPEPVALDLDGLELRKARLTIHSSSLGDAVLSKDGETLYYLARFERGYNLWSTTLRTHETKQLLALNVNGGSLAWDKDEKSLFLLADGGISKIDPASGKRENVSIRGELTLDAAAERAYEFEHVWRRTKETFYTAGYHGIDWDALEPVYRKYLPWVGDGYDFAEVLSEMLGELNVSHSEARYSASEPGDDATASLGVFYDQAFTGPGMEVVEVVKNGPLDRAGMNVRPGMIIESIDGEAIAADTDPARYLNRKAGKRTLLVVADGGARREIVVEPITQGEENRLLYDRWVRRNAREVDSLSNGQLGYVHIPGMNDGAYRNTYEEVMGKYADRKGIVVDTRFNGGGDLVADLAMFLSGERFFDYTTDTHSTGFEPNFRWTRPSVAIAGEANYSDGHCFAYAYQALKIGTLVGMPVPGTCTFSGWETLPDGSVRWGVPGMGVKDRTGHYLENHQTEPDVKVMNEFDVRAAGRDQQLEAAVAELKKAVR
jgi:tricorn protease